MAVEFREILANLSDGAGAPEMAAVVRSATRAIPGAEHAGVSLVSAGREPRTLFSTDDLPAKVDALQYGTGEGPCVAALNQSDLVLVADLAEDAEFPAFSPGAVELGVRSMLSTRLFLSEEHRAALNFYSHRPGAFTVDQLPVAAIFGAFASGVLLNMLREDTIVGLERAVDSNREIGVAVGILMANQRYTRQQAFDQLRSASQALNRLLRDVAEEVKLTGQLPQVPGRKHRGGATPDPGPTREPRPSADPA